MKRSTFFGVMTAVPAMSLATLARPAIATAIDPTLVAAKIKFYTTDNDKDKDSGPSVHLFSSNDIHNGTEFAYSDRLGGDRWADHSENGPWNLHLTTHPLHKSSVGTTWMYIDFATHGSDEWHFDAHLRLDWSDGSTTSLAQNGLILQNSTFLPGTEWPGGVISGNPVALELGKMQPDTWPQRP